MFSSAKSFHGPAFVGPGQRPWVGVPTSSVWTSVIPPCHQSPIGGNIRFLWQTAIVRPGSIGLFSGQLLIPPCMCICGMPREVSCTWGLLFKNFATKASH